MSQFTQTTAQALAGELAAAHPALTVNTRQNSDGSYVVHADGAGGWLAETDDADLSDWLRGQLQGH